MSRNQKIAMAVLIVGLVCTAFGHFADDNDATRFHQTYSTGGCTIYMSCTVLKNAYQRYNDLFEDITRTQMTTTVPRELQIANAQRALNAANLCREAIDAKRCR